MRENDYPIAQDPAFARLLEWLAIPSVSADLEYQDAVIKAGEWVCAQMDGVPGAIVELRKLPGAVHPSVVGRISASDEAKSAPTVAVYGHYDVQPPGRRSEWASDPFAPEVRDGWLYGRGTADSKANCFVMLEAIKRLAGEQALPVNIDFMYDGEEEIDGTAIPDYAAGRPAPDAAVIWDGGMMADGTPCLCVSARGTLYYRVSIRTGECELHSGTFGGAALNAASTLIASLQAASRVTLGGRGANGNAAALEALHDGEELLRLAGGTPADATAAQEFYERTVLRSAVDVNCISSGDVGLQKTAIPADATANISVRIAPGDDHRRIDEEIRALFAEHTPAAAELEIEALAIVPPGETDRDSEAVALGSAAFERAFGKRPELIGAGGTLPLFSVYAEREVPALLTGLATFDGGAHGANERFPLAHLSLGIAAASELLRALGGLTRQ